MRRYELAEEAGECGSTNPGEQAILSADVRKCSVQEDRRGRPMNLGPNASEM
jgi:hypothetical protein